MSQVLQAFSYGLVGPCVGARLLSQPAVPARAGREAVAVLPVTSLPVTSGACSVSWMSRGACRTA